MKLRMAVFSLSFSCWLFILIHSSRIPSTISKLLVLLVLHFPKTLSRRSFPQTGGKAVLKKHTTRNSLLTIKKGILFGIFREQGIHPHCLHLNGVWGPTYLTNLATRHWHHTSKKQPFTFPSHGKNDSTSSGWLSTTTRTTRTSWWEK